MSIHIYSCGTVGSFLFPFHLGVPSTQSGRQRVSGRFLSVNTVNTKPRFLVDLSRNRFAWDLGS